MKSGHQTSQHGFSLSETTLASGIVAFSLLPIVGLLAVVSIQNRKSIDDRVASVLAENVMLTLQRDSTDIAQFNWRFDDDSADGDGSNFDETVAEFIYPTSPNDAVAVYLVGDDIGRIVRKVSQSEYELGIEDAAFSEVVLIRVTMQHQQSNLYADANVDAALNLVVSVESPITAVSDSRRKNIYQTLTQ